MLLLVVSLLAIAAGPLLYRAANSAPKALIALDGFTVIAVSGLVVVHIVPHAVAVAGPLALVVALLGFFGPGFVENALHNAARRAHAATLILACVGLVVHEFLDGVALGVPSGEHGPGESDSASILALAVALHRIPVAVTVWWLLRPVAGIATAVFMLTTMFIATLSGYLSSEPLEAAMDSSWISLFQALVAGSLLHVIVHRPHPMLLPSSTQGEQIFAGMGAIVGLVLVAVLSETHMPLVHSMSGGDFADTFVTLALESAPALLIAFALAGLVQVFLPQWSVKWMRTDRPWSEALRGMAFGLPLPVCSCGVVPLYRSLITRGVPATAAMAFLVATPELGLDAVLISWPLLGGKMAVARIVASALVALAIGVIVGHLADTRRANWLESAPSQAVVRGNFWQRVRLGLDFGFGELVDHIGPWLLLGLVIASLVEPLMEGAWLSALPWSADVLLFTLIGMPIYVCASGATPLVAVLLLKGVSPGAALAFLLSGPATNITTFGVLSQLHGRRIAFAFACTMAAVATIMGIVLNVILGHQASGFALHESLRDEPGIMGILCLVAVAVVLAISVLRQGPREFVGQVITPFKDGHDDAHDHGHGHDHGPGHRHDHGHDHGPGHGHDHSDPKP